MKKILIFFLSIAVLLVFVLGSGCVSTIPANIEGDWVLPGTTTTISFSNDGTFHGQAPVNTYYGTYTLDRNTIMLKIQGLTKMSGSEEDMKAEEEYFKILSEVTAFSTPNSTLEFYGSRGKTILVFEKLKNNIIGTWKTDNGITITFEADSTFSGHAPINRYIGTYDCNGTSLQLNSVVSTEMAGSEENMKAESEYFEKLTMIHGFSLGSELYLLDTNGNTVLVFQKVN